MVEKTLGVTPGENGELALTYGALPRSYNEIAVLTRSMVEIPLELTAGIDVPGGHVTEGLTSPSNRVAVAPNPRDRPIVRIMSGASPPASAFASAQYGDTWYWIARNDLASRSEHSPS